MAVEQVFAQPTTRDLDTTGRHDAAAVPGWTRTRTPSPSGSRRLGPCRRDPVRELRGRPSSARTGPAPLAFPQPGPAAWHWAALGLAGLLGIVLLVEVVLSLSGATGGDAEAAAFVVIVLPRLLLAAGAGGVASLSPAVGRRRRRLRCAGRRRPHDRVQYRARGPGRLRRHGRGRSRGRRGRRAGRRPFPVSGRDGGGARRVARGRGVRRGDGRFLLRQHRGRLARRPTPAAACSTS